MKNILTKKRRNIVAFIPARQGSKRIKNKNIIKLSSHPLIAHTIIAAKKSKIFNKIVVSTDSKKYAKIARYYGADVNGLRPKKFSNSFSPDYQWVKYELNFLQKKGFFFTHFFILRPTNPFRSSKTIIKSWRLFLKNKKADSLRAVEITKYHPGKMWIKKKQYIIPLIKGKINKQPYYNLQFTSLPKIFIQNASLEISKTQVVNKYNTITGKKIIPFFTKQNEGFDINYPEDIIKAKFLINKNKAVLENIKKNPFK